MKLKEWLELKKLTQDQFSAQSGIPQTTISRLCRGQPTSSEMMRTIFEATDGEVTPNDLVLQTS